MHDKSPPKHVARWLKQHVVEDRASDDQALRKKIASGKQILQMRCGAIGYHEEDWQDIFALCETRQTYEEFEDWWKTYLRVSQAGDVIYTWGPYLLDVDSLRARERHAKVPVQDGAVTHQPQEERSSGMMSYPYLMARTNAVFTETLAIRKSSFVAVSWSEITITEQEKREIENEPGVPIA